MKNKRILAVLALAAVAASSLTAWVVLRAPAADLSRFSLEPTSEAMYAAGGGTFAEPRKVIASVPEPTSIDFYAAGGGTFCEPKPAAASAPEPTSVEFYAANGGVLD